MTSLTIRNLDEDVKTGLRQRAARNGVSMESEARAILREAVGAKPKPKLTEEEIEAKVQRILALGRKPEAPFDLQKECDGMWSFVET